MLKLTTRLVTAPMMLMAGIIYIIGHVAASLSSLVTNLVGTVFLIGSFCSWRMGVNTDTVALMVVTGVVVLLLPMIVKGLLYAGLKLIGLLAGLVH
ncbi:MAG: hypothetical protein Q4C54_04625 [Clostridia bacterium]|nr:hypothetical protein [Clostridia bacterium]